jgi:hypothetical protein
MNHPDERAKHIDECLGGALEHFSHAEPQPALESRIVTYIRLQREHAARSRACGAALAVAAALFPVTVAVTLVHREDYGPVVMKTENRGPGSASSSGPSGGVGRRKGSHHPRARSPEKSGHCASSGAQRGDNDEIEDGEQRIGGVAVDVIPLVTTEFGAGSASGRVPGKRSNRRSRGDCSRNEFDPGSYGRGPECGSAGRTSGEFQGRRVRRQ